MNTLVIGFMLFALASPIFGEEQNLEPKKQEKRGLVGLGYGAYPGAYGYNGVYGYNGLGHGYAAAPYYSSLNHGAAAAPLLSHSSYVAPLTYSHGYAGYNGYQAAPLYTAPLRLGYHGLNHGSGHYNYW